MRVLDVEVCYDDSGEWMPVERKVIEYAIRLGCRADMNKAVREIRDLLDGREVRSIEGALYRCAR